MYVVHTYPVRDLLDHEIDCYPEELCTCLPFEKSYEREDGTVAVQVIHNAWDGRL